MAHEYQNYKGQILGASNINGETRQVKTDDNGILQTSLVGSLANNPNLFTALSIDYAKLYDRPLYQIWKTTSSATTKIMALHRKIAVRYNLVTTLIEISKTGINGIYDSSVIFNSTNFPGLINDSVVSRMLILPMTRDLDLLAAQYASDWRLVVITNKGQIYHNWPSRAVGSDTINPPTADITKFEESFIWDLPVNKYPSTDPSATGTEKYFPGLPSTCYEYHPMLNTDVDYVDTYNNGGYGKSRTISVTGVGDVVFPRFYIPTRTNANSFNFMGGYESDDKITIIGTYSNNTTGSGARVCVFMTDDGGRNWFNKLEFADNGTSSQWANSINTTDIATVYTTDSFVLKKRTLVVPTDSVKEPTTLFTLGADVVIKSISKTNPAVVETEAVHGLTTGNVIVILDNSGSGNLSADYDWMKNDTVSTSSGGTGTFFKVKKLTDTTFELYDYVHSAFTNIPARHIHSINRLKDGWIVGTGESYPEGWLYYIQMAQADTTSVARAYNNFVTVRMNSGSESVQRILGAILYDDNDGTLIFASDAESVPRKYVSPPAGRTNNFFRTSIGVFRGRYVDIDDFDNFECILQTTQVAFMFKEKCNNLIFVGGKGELSMSSDKGNTWTTEDIQEPRLGKGYIFLGIGYDTSCRYLLLDDVIIIFKS